MSQISSAQPSADINLFWQAIGEYFYNNDNPFSNFFKDNRKNFSNIDFLNDIEDLLTKLSVELQTRENTKHTQVVVAGGFSSGKSSFLNKLVGDGNLLPTGVEPVSVVPTYIYCSSQNQNTLVKGVNSKNAVIALPTDVLQVIQHSNKSNIYVASVLEKLFVEVNAPRVRDFVFIDTPGYNNSNKRNQSNGKTDEQTAANSLKEGQALIWLIDCDKGTTVSDDLNIIKQFRGPKLIVFHKADKKGKDCNKIVNEAASELIKKFGDDIIDVIAYSSLEQRLYASYNGYRTLDEIFSIIHNLGVGTSSQNACLDEIRAMFDDEISTSKLMQDELNAEWEGAVREKNEMQKKKRKFEGVFSDEKNTVIDVCQNYADLYHRYIRMGNIASNSIDDFWNFYEGVMNFETNDHWGSSSILTKAINIAKGKHQKDLRSFNDMLTDDFQPYNLDYILGDFKNDILMDIDMCLDQCNKLLNDQNNHCQSLKNDLSNEKKFCDEIERYKGKMLDAIQKGIDTYLSKNTSCRINQEDSQESDVFMAIKKSDIKSFVFSLSNGVDIHVCNPEGFSPLTYAVHLGNREIVKFLLEHDADPAAMDRRGYNAFLTAVENQARDMCQMILDYDDSLIDSTTAAGEDACSLASKQTFSKWLDNQF